MNKTIAQATQKEPRALISALWIVVLINILSADIFSFMLGGAGEAAAVVTP